MRKWIKTNRYLRHNPIGTLPIPSSGSCNLNYLDAKNTSIKEIPPSITRCSRLQELFVIINKLHTLAKMKVFDLYVHNKQSRGIQQAQVTRLHRSTAVLRYSVCSRNLALKDETTKKQHQRSYNFDWINRYAFGNNITQLPIVYKKLRYLSVAQNNISSVPLHRMRLYSSINTLFVTNQINNT